MLGVILLGSLLLIRLAGGRFTGMRSYVDLAFMGAAFLLLETKNIIQFALLFGTTWFVNSLVFAGVLVAVYLAVETARRVRLPRPAVVIRSVGRTGSSRMSPRSTSLTSAYPAIRREPRTAR
jgi:hypothetical protein